MMELEYQLVFNSQSFQGSPLAVVDRSAFRMESAVIALGHTDPTSGKHGFQVLKLGWLKSHIVYSPLPMGLVGPIFG